MRASLLVGGALALLGLGSSAAAAADKLVEEINPLASPSPAALNSPRLGNQETADSEDPSTMTLPATSFTWSHGSIIRGPRDEKKIALIFTGGDFGEGSLVVLDTLKQRGLKGSFFFTGDYLRKPAHAEPLRRVVAEGHYLGPHGDAHLLYCPWDDRDKTLVTKQEFTDDLLKNINDIVALGVPREQITWWIPPYEWYNNQITDWSLDAGMRLFNFTPGTLSHTDYTEDDAKNYRGCDLIYNSILDFEAKNEDGLNGFLLLTHVGAGEKRTDKFFNRLGSLIDDLKARGYTFVRVDEMLKNAPKREQ
jgi:peptidoglycan/xylan/chitin deacetylase (PgdA/CDA1 family)